MNKIGGMAEAFKLAKVVYLTTFSNGRERSRQMTNFNEYPYEMMWFPTEIGTRKVLDIQSDSKVLVTFPSGNPGEYYEIEGKAEIAGKREVEEKWRWWYLYWHPEQKDRFWFPGSRFDEKRAIINIQPILARIVNK